MTNYGPTVRLALLLHHMDTDEFKPLPQHVGLKTVNLAERSGFVEVNGSLKAVDAILETRQLY